jgi:hypothetical protein
MTDRRNILVPAFLALAVGMLAQAPLQVGGVYECPAVQSGIKVIACAGPGNGDLCDVQITTGGQLRPGKLPRQQVAGMLQVCHLQTPAEAQAAARGGARPAVAAPQTGAGGFKVGDTVQALTGFGWMDSKVLQIKGNSYLVHTEAGPEVWKDYPAEIRRVGNLTAADHAAGQYTLHDKVQVNVQGQWVEGQVIGTLNDEYQVSLPGNRSAWAKPQNLRPSTAPPPPAPPKAGTPPKPGYVSCAGKIEGRYSSSAGFGGFTITFRAGKATVAGGITGVDAQVECWISGTKILLHNPAESDMDLPLDVNNDGSLDTPLGEIRKKGN